MSKPALSIVVPCYNEEDTLVELHRRVSAVCRGLGLSSYELLLINDGSLDKTWSIILAMAREDDRIVGINLSRNHGHQLALTAGLSQCQGDRVAILDADLQDPPELLPEMLDLMDTEKADVVFGQRRTREGETPFKLLTASLFYRIIGNLSDVPIPRDSGDFRLLSRRALDALMAMPERHRFLRGMVSWIGFRQVPLLYDRQARFAGSTKYPFRKMLRFALDAITAFSIKPLLLASFFGVLMAVFALALGLYSVIAYFRGSTVAGWTSLMTVTTLLCSVQLFVLGIHGEYIGRMYEQIKGRPLFIIQQIVRSGGKSTLPDQELSRGNTHVTARAPSGAVENHE
jgi:dolichol-phosphate mannosyltransferase